MNRSLGVNDKLSLDLRDVCKFAGKFTHVGDQSAGDRVLLCSLLIRSSRLVACHLTLHFLSTASPLPLYQPVVILFLFCFRSVPATSHEFNVRKEIVIQFCVRTLFVCCEYLALIISGILVFNDFFQVSVVQLTFKTSNARVFSILVIY